MTWGEEERKRQGEGRREEVRGGRGKPEEKRKEKREEKGSIFYLVACV